MVDMDSDLVLAPIEDTLEEGEVHVEEESEEDAPSLRLAPNVVSPSKERLRTTGYVTTPIDHGASNASWDVASGSRTQNRLKSPWCQLLVWTTFTSPRRVSVGERS